MASPKSGKAAGGLAVGVLSALRAHGGIWFGWSGKTTPTEPGEISRMRSAGIEYVTVDLNAQDFEGYYNGFSNNALWPLLHFMLGYFSFSRSDYGAYLRVNEFLARRLAPMLEPDDLIWVHDFHLFPLGTALRDFGASQPLGFFLHVPLPSFEVLRSLPCYMQILRWLAAYDVVGFQTEQDLAAFRACMTQPEIGGCIHDDGRVSAFGRTFQARVFPIGIDVEECQELARKNSERKQVLRLAESLKGRRLIIGVDRLDYSKGLELRFRGFEALLEAYPSTRGQVVYLQIAPPTRTGVRTYDTIRSELEKAAGNINGRYAEMDWIPIRYLNRGYSRELLMGIFRRASVALVTPVRDGMNLVVKEYVASQDPKSPGIPVLSTLCGAARELTDAVLVNPYDRRGVADGLQRAIEMPLGERRAKHSMMLAKLKRNDVHAWSRRFLESLESSRRH